MPDLTAEAPTQYNKRMAQDTKPAGISGKVIRILDAYTLIAQNTYPSVALLKDKLEISERSVYRYLEIINMIDPIDFDRERDGYKFTNAARIKKFRLSERDFLLLLAMGESVSHLGEPLKNYYKAFIEKFLCLSDASMKSGTVPIFIKMPEAIDSEAVSRYFSVMSTCISEKRSIDLTYRSKYSEEINERRIDPYGLIFYEGAWIMIGYCHLRVGIRQFALDRIIELKETHLKFQPIEGFELSKYLAPSWGIYDEDPVEVVVRFPLKVRELLERKAKWHPSERRKVLDDGGIELTFTVAGVQEIKRWVYSWLPWAEVVSPQWFREKVRAELSEAVSHHS